MISNRNLIRNTGFNLIGQGAPLLVALLTMPILIRQLGPERFGILTLAWMVIGYFSLFDLGLGRALTKLVAEKLGCNKEREIPGLFWTSMVLMTALGVVGTLVMGLLTPWLVEGVLEIPEELRAETRISFYMLAASVPIVIDTTGLRGVLEAYQRFGLINMIRLPMGLVTYLGPLLVVTLSGSLPAVVAVLAVSRLLALLIHLDMCRRVVPDLFSAIRIEKRAVKPLLHFGSWMTVTNVVGPLMVYLDRFLIGSLVSVAAVAYYCTPYEIVTKLWLIPGALVGVLFPAFSSSYVQDRNYTAELFARGVKYTFLAIFPLTLAIVIFAYEGLELWLGSEFASQGFRVLQLLAVGVLINCLANIPYNLIQGAGRPDLAAKLHLVELPCYLVCLWMLLKMYGINGAAVAWLLRVAVDAAFLFRFAGRILPPKCVFNTFTLVVIGGIGTLLAACLITATLAVKVAILSIAFTIAFPASWFFLLSLEERNWLNAFTKSR